MKIEKSSSTLVIIGGWNRHIFTEDWIRRYIFPGEHDEFKIEMFVTSEFNGQYVNPRILSKQIVIFLHESKLNFGVVEINDECFYKIQEIATQLADFLPHTPVTAYGVNFLFSIDNFDEDLIYKISLNDLVDNAQELGTITHQQITRQFKGNRRTLNFNIKIKEKQLFFDFNYHYEISDLIAFKAGIFECEILDLKQEALDFMFQTYNLELEGFQNE